jgi:hypothetical protein
MMEGLLARCDTCGNDYDKSFQIVMSGRTQTFDSFECAIQSLAPTCAHCGCRILGHGIEEKGSMYCRAHCAKQHGARSRLIARPGGGAGVEKRVKELI